MTAKTARKTKRVKNAHPILILMFILTLGLACRVLLMPAKGFEPDLGINKGWAISAATFGVGESYVKQTHDTMIPNYPPLSMLMFASVGNVFRALEPTMDIHSPLLQILIKTPGVIFDLLTCIVLYAIVTWWRKNPIHGHIAALVYAFHPAVLHDGVFWGQTDSFFTLLLVCAVAVYARGHIATAGAFFMLAVLAKMQAIAVAPLFLFLALSGGWKSVLKMGAGATIAAVVVLTPYAATHHLKDSLKIYSETVGYYAVVSSSAYNFWWSLFADKAGEMNDLDALALGISYRTVALALYAFWSATMLWFLRRKLTIGRDAVPALFLGAAFLMMTFFEWNTQMHERYMFAFIALAVPTLFISKRGIKLFLAASTLFLINLLGWLPATWIDRWAYEKFPTLDVFVASMTVVVFFGYLGYVWKVSRMTQKIH